MPTESGDEEVTIISERGVERGVVEGNTIRVTSGGSKAPPSLSTLWGEMHALVGDTLSYHAWVRRSAEIEGQIRAEERAHQRDLLRRCAVLVRLLTVRQVIEAGDEAIEAAGLNPYAINEGRATGDERLNPWWLETRPNTGTAP
jgi:hypothetical protein